MIRFHLTLDPAVTIALAVIAISMGVSVVCEVSTNIVLILDRRRRYRDPSSNRREGQCARSY